MRGELVIRKKSGFVSCSIACIFIVTRPVNSLRANRTTFLAACCFSHADTASRASKNVSGRAAQMPSLAGKISFWAVEFISWADEIKTLATDFITLPIFWTLRGKFYTVG